MLLGARQMWRGKTESYPWDYRVKYVESVDSRAYFLLREALPTNLTPSPTAFDATWEDLWEVVLGVLAVDKSDKHLFGKSYAFGLAQYGGKWRPSYRQDWPTNQNIPIATYNPVMYRAETGVMRCFTADGKTQIWKTTGDIYPYCQPSGYGSFIAVGIMFNDQNKPTDRYKRASNRIYSFRRVCQNVPEFTLIPCVKDGVPCFYDEVSGAFCASTSGTPFVAGPRVNDDGTDIT